MSGAAIVPAVRTELAAPVDEFSSAIAQVIRAAENPSVDPAKVRELYAIAKEMQADRARVAYKGAIIRVHSKLPEVVKAGIAEVRKEGKLVRRTPFARYEDIHRVVRPILRDEGLAPSFNTRAVTGGAICVCEMSHVMGHSEFRELPLPSDQSGGKNGIQAIGSMISYAKRYLLGMHLDLLTVGEDDDGAGGTITEEQALELAADLHDAGGDPVRFLKIFGVERFDQITARDLKKAQQAIDDKRRAKK